MCVDAGIGGSVAYPATRYPTLVLPSIVRRVGVHVRDKTPLHGRLRCAIAAICRAGVARPPADDAERERSFRYPPPDAFAVEWPPVGTLFGHDKRGSMGSTRYPPPAVR